ncbi:MAG: hypothetical protein IH945_06635 [Armatimonadetes bacterium]|nr:hypothetical protein [Armatimonadota bacterium]
MRVLLVVFFCGSALNLAFAQPGVQGAGQYPQFRNLSGLPGAGFGVMPDGRLSSHGALAYSTPVAYSMRGWDIVLGATNVSNTMRLSILKDDNGLFFDGNEGNGTLQMLVGISLGDYGNATFSHLILSSFMDSAQSLHWSPPRQHGAVRFGIGVQDMTGQGSATGDGLPGDEGNSRSYYAVGTWDAGAGTFMSLGTGDTRFKPIFGSVSFAVGERVKAFGEYEAYHWNYGFAFDAGKLLGSVRAGRATSTTIMLGAVKGKYAYWSVSVGF